MVNLEKSYAAEFERSQKSIEYRLKHHGAKGATRRWFPEYAVNFPGHVRSPIHQDKHLPNVLPQHRVHFCEFLDSKRSKWMQRNLIFIALANEPYSTPAGNPPVFSPKGHGIIQAKLMSWGIYEIVRDKWMRANPGLVSPSGKRVAYGSSHHFDHYLLSIIARCEAVEREHFTESRLAADRFQELIEKNRQDEIERRRLVKKSNTEMNLKNMAKGTERKEALEIKKSMLADWQQKYGHLFRRKPSIRRRAKMRKMAEEAGEAVDPKVRDKIRWIKLGPCVCHWCAKKLHDGGTIDHIVPVTRGGPHTCLNIVPACWPCNRDKGATMPDSAEMPVGDHLELALV